MSDRSRQSILTLDSGIETKLLGIKGETESSLVKNLTASERLKTENRVDERLTWDVSAVFSGSDLSVQDLIDNILKRAEITTNHLFGKWVFGFGVFNMLFIVFMFGAYPQYFWILYVVESLYFFPFRFYLDWNHKPFSNTMYAIDYCWLTNIAIFCLLCAGVFAGDRIFESVQFKNHIFSLLFGIACGPLIAATIVLPLPLAFHDNEHMSSIFIHFFPPALLYIIRYKNDIIAETFPSLDASGNFECLRFWPGDCVADDGAIVNTTFTLSIFGIMVIQYFAWVAIYTIWLFLSGMDLPRKYRHKKLANGLSAPAIYDTCFHANMRDGGSHVFGKYLWKLTDEELDRKVDENDFEFRDYFAYIILHAIGTLGSVVVIAWPCLHSKEFHAFMLVFGMLMVVTKGAIYYGKLIYTMCTELVQDSLEHEIMLLMNKKGIEEGVIDYEDDIDKDAPQNEPFLPPKTIMEEDGDKEKEDEDEDGAVRFDLTKLE